MDYPSLLELLKNDYKNIKLDRNRLINAKNLFTNKLKTKNKNLSKNKRRILNNRLKEINKRQIINDIYNAFLDNNDKLAVNIINNYYSLFSNNKEYVVYLIYKNAISLKLYGVISRILVSNRYLDLITDYLQCNSNIEKYSLTSYEYLLSLIISDITSINNIKMTKYFIENCNISKLNKSLVRDILQFVSKNGNIDMFNYLINHMDIDETNIETSYTTAILFENDEIIKSLNNKFPEFIKKSRLKLRRSFDSGEVIESIHDITELEVAKILTTFC